jgi:hypothetical protein
VDRVLELELAAATVIAYLMPIGVHYIDQPFAIRCEIAEWLCDCGAGEAGRELAAQLLKDDDSELRRPLTRARKATA